MAPDANDFVAWLKWTAGVVAAASVVLGVIYKAINNMISKKIQSQLRVTVRELTEATSGSIDALREEMKERNDRSDEERRDAESRIDRRLDGMTRRVDEILNTMLKR